MNKNSKKSFDWSFLDEDVMQYKAEQEKQKQQETTQSQSFNQFSFDFLKTQTSVNQIPPKFKLDISFDDKPIDQALVNFNCLSYRVPVSFRKEFQEVKGKEKDDNEDLDEKSEDLEKKDSRYFAQNPFQLCFRCKKSGHISRMCSELYKELVKNCFFCLQDDHLSYQCNTMVCFKCNNVGHMARDCKMINTGKMCHICGKKGHDKDDCRVIDIKSFYHQKYFSKNELSLIKCMNCKKNGHFNCTSIPNKLTDNIYKRPLIDIQEDKESQQNHILNYDYVNGDQNVDSNISINQHKKHQSKDKKQKKNDVLNYDYVNGDQNKQSNIQMNYNQKNHSRDRNPQNGKNHDNKYDNKHYQQEKKQEKSQEIKDQYERIQNIAKILNDERVQHKQHHKSNNSKNEKANFVYSSRIDLTNNRPEEKRHHQDNRQQSKSHKNQMHHNQQQKNNQNVYRKDKNIFMQTKVNRQNRFEVLQKDESYSQRKKKFNNEKIIKSFEKGSKESKKWINNEFSKNKHHQMEDRSRSRFKSKENNHHKRR